MIFNFIALKLNFWRPPMSFEMKEKKKIKNDFDVISIDYY